MIALVSVSGGKDSTATLLLALESGLEVRAAFADTGNEHPLTYEYVEYLEARLGVQVRRLRQDFTEWWWQRRDYVRDKWPEKGVAAPVVARALAVFERGPTGIPFLDLCIIKGRFPSRMAQFCTQLLKTEPLTEYALDLVGECGSVESWQGIRAEESPRRAKAPEREVIGGGLSIYRPILRWTVEMVFQKHREVGINPNPLYRLGMGRVGCMPCINARKGELAEIAKRFPDQIDRIAEWEGIVADASKRGQTTFIPAPGENETAWERGNIRAVVRWASARDACNLFADEEELPACSSAYGLCE